MGVEYRELSLRSWEAAAPGWARWSTWTGAMSRPVTAWLFEHLDVQPGATILELAAGTGDAGYLLAERIGAEGRLITTDFSAAMVEYARRRAAALDVEAEVRVMDAERMELEDASVDGVLCRYGLMLMADPAAALRETWRVLRPGGRLAFATWSAPERNPWASVVARVLVERGALPAPERGQPGIFALADGDHVRRLVEEAGFDEVVLEEIPLTLEYESFPNYWDFVTQAAGAVSGVIAALPEDARDDVRHETGERMQQFKADGGRLDVPAVSLAVAAS